jgi:MFS family permease
MSDPGKKRRLPIVSQSGLPAESPEPEEERPAWHWSGIGAVATFLTWLPLAAIAAKLGARIAERASIEGFALPFGARLVIIGLQLAGFLVGAFAGGFLVGRFGDKAGPRQAAVGGFVAAAVAWALAAASPTGGPGPATWVVLLVVLGGLGAATGFWGGRVGFRRRHPAERP